LNANGGLADTLLVSDEGKLLHIGHCADVVQAAAHLYDEAAVQLFGKEAQVNFPGEEGELQAQEQHQDDLRVFKTKTTAHRKKKRKGICLTH
jgi:hypothetical protein